MRWRTEWSARGRQERLGLKLLLPILGALVIFTFVPLTAPFVVPVRTALQAIPVWQYAAAVIISLVTLVVLTGIAGRIYSGGLLRYGGRVGVREAWRSAGE